MGESTETQKGNGGGESEAGYKNLRQNEKNEAAFERVRKNQTDQITIDIFKDVYPLEEIDNDRRKVSMLKVKFDAESTEYQKRMRERSKILESIVTERIELDEWLGPETYTISPTEYDDLMNGTDIIIEFPGEEGEGKQLCIDITTSNASIVEKIKRIKQQIDEGSLSKIKYFYSPYSETKGEKDMVPRVVLPVTHEFYVQLRDCWMERKNKELASHPLKQIFLESSLLQLHNFREYAQKQGLTEVVKVYDEIIDSINSSQLEETIGTIDENVLYYDRNLAELKKMVDLFLGSCTAGKSGNLYYIERFTRQEDREEKALAAEAGEKIKAGRKPLYLVVASLQAKYDEKISYVRVRRIADMINKNLAGQHIWSKTTGSEDTYTFEISDQLEKKIDEYLENFYNIPEPPAGANTNKMLFEELSAAGFATKPDMVRQIATKLAAQNGITISEYRNKNNRIYPYYTKELCSLVFREYDKRGKEKTERKIYEAKPGQPSIKELAEEFNGEVSNAFIRKIWNSFPDQIFLTQEPDTHNIIPRCTETLAEIIREEIISLLEAEEPKEDEKTTDEVISFFERQLGKKAPRKLILRLIEEVSGAIPELVQIRRLGKNKRQRCYKQDIIGMIRYDVERIANTPTPKENELTFQEAVSKIDTDYGIKISLTTVEKYAREAEKIQSGIFEDRNVKNKIYRYLTKKGLKEILKRIQIDQQTPVAAIGEVTRPKLIEILQSKYEGMGAKQAARYIEEAATENPDLKFDRRIERDNQRVPHYDETKIIIAIEQAMDAEDNFKTVDDITEEFGIPHNKVIEILKSIADTEPWMVVKKRHGDLKKQAFVLPEILQKAHNALESYSKGTRLSKDGEKVLLPPDIDNGERNAPQIAELLSRELDQKVHANTVRKSAERNIQSVGEGETVQRALPTKTGSFVTSDFYKKSLVEAILDDLRDLYSTPFPKSGELGIPELRSIVSERLGIGRHRFNRIKQKLDTENPELKQKRRNPKDNQRISCYDEKTFLGKFKEILEEEK